MKVVLIGDSIVASISTNALSILTAGGRTVTNLAVAGHTAAQQLAVWLASAVRGDGTQDVIVIQVGVNDVRTGVVVATTLANIETLLNDIATQNPTARIVLGLMLPARGNSSVTPRYESHWVPVNDAYRAAGSGSIPTAVDLVMTAPSDVDFNDGDDFLVSGFSEADGLHPTPAGNRLNAAGMRTAINAAMDVVEELPDGGAGRGELQYLGTWRTTNIAANFNTILARAGAQPTAVQVRRRCRVIGFQCSMDTLGAARPAAGSAMTIQAIATTQTGVDQPAVTVGQMLVGESNVDREATNFVQLEAGGHVHIKVITDSSWTGTTCNPAVRLLTEET